MQGQWFSAIDGFKVYLLGNPIIWWGNLVVLAAFVFVYAYQAYRRQRGAYDDRQTKGMLHSHKRVTYPYHIYCCHIIQLYSI